MKRDRFGVPAILLGCAVVAALVAARPSAANGDGTAGTIASASAAASPVVVTIKDFAYSPSVVSVPVGGSVTWKNLDQAGHTVTDDKKAFDSGNLDTGKTWTHTFTQAGTYRIICTYHPSMHGIVQVGSGSLPPPPSPDSGY